MPNISEMELHAKHIVKNAKHIGDGTSCSARGGEGAATERGNTRFEGEVQSEADILVSVIYQPVSPYLGPKKRKGPCKTPGVDSTYTLNRW
jgi:hypothetical protein